MCIIPNMNRNKSENSIVIGRVAATDVPVAVAVSAVGAAGVPAADATDVSAVGATDVSAVGATDEVMVQRLAEAVRAAGGRAWAVGGCVRDKLLGLKPKDYDVEVHGLGEAELQAVLAKLGRIDTVGKAFGIYTLSGTNIDVALPREEKLVGAGHRDFAVAVKPELDCRLAAARRDFTFNAIMEDPLTGEIFDPYGGRDDLARGRLHFVEAGRFGEDPLRVFRAAQFAARFDCRATDELVDICRKMSLVTLPRERVAAELHKALVQGGKPGNFFTFLAAVEQLRPWFGEVAAVKSMRQLVAVLDRGARFREESSVQYGFMLAVLGSELGEEGNFGLAAAAKLLERLGIAKNIQKYVLTQLTEFYHLKNVFDKNDANLAAFLRSTAADLPEQPDEGWGLTTYCPKLAEINRCWFKAAVPRDLLLLAKTLDLLTNRSEARRQQAVWWASYTIFETLQKIPPIQGRDLVAEGLEPGPRFGCWLERAENLRRGGLSRRQAIAMTVADIKAENFSCM